MKHIVTVLALCLLKMGFAQNQDLKISAENAFPEGLAYSFNTNSLYTGSMMHGTLYRAGIKEKGFKAMPVKENPPSALGIKAFTDRLYVANGTNGTVGVFSSTYRQKLYEFTVPKNLGEKEIFINDVAVWDTNKGYVTDSFRPMIYEFDQAKGNTLHEWLNLDDTVIKYQSGYNLNGIVLTKNKAFLIVIQTNTGELFRIDTKTKKVAKIKVSGAPLRNGDGIAIDGDTLYVAINVAGKLAKVELNSDFTNGTSSIIKEGLAFPTAVAIGKDAIYVLNSQLDKAGQDDTKITDFKVTVLPKS